MGVFVGASAGLANLRNHDDGYAHMKISALQNAHLAVLLASASVMICSLAAAQSKDAGPPTRQANAEVLRSLPLADRGDFADAQRGFVASLLDAHVTGAGQRVIWSMKPYAFARGEAPATAHPG